MKVIGKRISNMDTAKNHGPTVQTTKENITKAKNMAKVITSGTMDQNMKGNGLIIKLKVMEIISGKMAECLQDFG